MAATYTTFDDVNRVLRASAESKIRFSDQALIEVVTKDINNKSNSDILVDFGSIVISDDYVAKRILKFQFTSTTDYDVFLVDTTIKRDLLLGSGDIASSYVTPDGLITVPAGVFSGTIEVGDTVDITFDAHMSKNDAILYIEDTEITIDAMLSDLGSDYLTGAETRLFPTAGDVPLTISVAAQYLSAYYIYTDVYRGKFVDEETFVNSYAQRWKRRADKMINQYARQSGRVPPKILSFPSFIDEFGLSFVGGSPGKLSDDVDEITRDSGSSDIFENN